jgi:hypothetical protein
VDKDVVIQHTKEKKVARYLHGYGEVPAEVVLVALYNHTRVIAPIAMMTGEYPQPMTLDQAKKIIEVREDAWRICTSTTSEVG